MHLINRSITQALDDKIPYEVENGVKPNVNYLRVFGCIAFALIPSHKHQKLNDKLEKCIFVEYCSVSKVYKLYNPSTCKVIVSRDMVFHEGSWLK